MFSYFGPPSFVQSNILGLVALRKDNIRHSIFGFMGGEQQQFLFLALVCGGWKDIFATDGKETVCSQIVTSASRVREAVGHGWVASNGAWGCAAAQGEMEVLLTLKSDIDAQREWEERGWEDDFEREVEWNRVSWGDGIFASAALAGQDKGMKLLIVAGCNEDDMGLTALQVAVDSGSVDVVDCCFPSDYWSEDILGRTEKQGAAREIVIPSLELAMGVRYFDMVRSLSRFVERRDDGLEAKLMAFTKDDDVEKVRAVKGWIFVEVHVFKNTFWTAASHGSFRVVLQMLTLWWSEDPLGRLDGLNPVPDGILYMVARLGHLRTLQWCVETCNAICRHSCIFCAVVEGWSRVPADAAGTGHVNVVLWCLDNGCEYTDGAMEAAAKEGRENVVMALAEGGFSCRVNVEEAAPPQVPGDNLLEMFLRELPRCACF